QSGGLLSGTGTLTVSGAASLGGGAMSGAGTTVLQGTSTLNAGAGTFILDAGRILRNEGTLTWSGGTLALNSTFGPGAGDIENAAGAVFEATGNNILQASNVGGGDIGTDASFSNAGTFRKTTGTGTTTIGVAFNNTGTVDVQSGTLTFSADVTQHLTNTLTGGTWRVAGTGTLNLNEPGAQNIITNQADVTLDGAAASFARINTLTDNQGAFRLLGGRNFTAAGAFANSGLLQLAGGAFDAPGLTNTASGEIFGFGTVTPTVLNHGLVRAAGGTLSFTGGVDGQSGTLQSDAGATLALGAASDGDFLVNNGSLDLGAFDVTVAEDYTNANFGSGNAFNARANVSGTGQILAAGDVAQTLTGDVADGATQTASLAFGNLHVGDAVTRHYRVANTGTSGPALRGAIQTSVNGGNLSDARLSGSGATAGDFGPLAVGTDSGDRAVTLTGSSAGALVDQRVAVVNNFDNVDEQVLSFSGAVYRYANPSTHAPAPVDFGNRRVGDVVSQALTLTNDVPADGFSEALDASIGNATGAATTNGGSISLLAAGATDSTSLAVGLDTSSAGHKTGTALISLASNGTGTSELGITALTAQTVNVSGNVYRLASPGAHSPAPVVFANRHVGDAASQALTLANTAIADGFSEALNASIGGPTGAVTTNGGSISLLAAGATDSSSLAVGIDTSSAGHKSGTALITLTSDGTGTSGFGALALGSQTVEVSGDVYRLASAGPIGAVEFGNVHVGDVVSQTLSLTNTAVADGFSEALDASFGGVSDGRILVSGAVSALAAGAVDNGSLTIALDTSNAGSLVGFATLNLASNGAGSSGLGITSLGSVNVGVTTNVAVYRYAEGVIDNAQPIDFGAYRVGDSAAQVALAVRNAAANDGFSEALNATVSSVDAGFTGDGSAALIAAGASDVTSLTVGVDTGTAGVKSGAAEVAFVSDGAGSSELGQTARGSQSVALSARVYATAVAEVAQSSVDFGIVHVGDVVTARALTVRNVASGSLADSLLGEITTVPAAFSGTGSLGAEGLAQGAVSEALLIGLDTSTAGVFGGDATLALASHNPDMADVNLAPALVALAAQVNNYANPVLDQAGGAGAFASDGTSFVLDFGTLTQGTGGLTALLSLANLVSGPADVLGADFDFAAGPFSLDGFTSFGGLVAGDARGLTVGFDPLLVGLFEQVVNINLYGENSSGFRGDLGSFELTLRANVNAVPVPGAVWMLGSGLLALLGVRRRG
ncbi:MAG: beta strand repeat-containing protein, partial [Gammaproteobacteria bacterium]